MTIETPAPQSALRPVSGNPDVHHSYADDDWDLETPIDPRVGWSLSYGCKVTVGFDGDVLHVTVSTCDRDQRDGITKRGVTREQVADYARKLAALVGVDASEVDSQRAELAAFVEASLEPLDYTADGECTGWEPTDYERAKANITEMHRVLNVREGRLFDAMDERKRLDAEVERLTAENAELRHALDVAERHEVDVRLDVERDLRDEAAKAGA